MPIRTPNDAMTQPLIVRNRLIDIMKNGTTKLQTTIVQ